MLRGLVDLVLPERCAACGGVATSLCASCGRAAGFLRLPDGGPVRLGPAVLAIAAFRYDGVIARAIRDVKTPGRHRAAVHLGRLLWAELADAVPEPATWPRTWVPSTPGRLRHRGADIPRLLAGPAAVSLLRRTRQCNDQTALSADQRRIARRGDFRHRQSVPRRVVLVDDVRTTGGTAAAAAGALVRGGAERVLVVTLAAVTAPGATPSSLTGQMSTMREHNGGSS
jgi:predicted amidophosphoribosyltransferase